MKFSLSLSALVSLLPAILAAPSNSYFTQYAHTKVLRIPTSDSQASLDALQALIESLEFETWTGSFRLNSHVDVEVPQSQYTSFVDQVNTILDQSGVRAAGFGIEVMHEDLGASILEEAPKDDGSVFRAAQVGLANPAWFNKYHSYADHLTFLNDLVATYPNNSRIVTAGKSHEGRDLVAINVYGEEGPGTKPAIIWYGNIHAREWITSKTVEYLAYELLNNYGNSTEIKGYVDKYDFYIFPVTNPDGFVYSQTRDRMWRKTRLPAPAGSTCVGVDPNRNWDIAWNESGGASTNPCNQDFKGKAPASAPEIANLADFGRSLANSTAGLKSFVDWHSYSQMFFTPYGYDCNKQPENHDELMTLAGQFVEALGAVYGTKYEYGPSCTTIYKTTGASDDWHGSLGIQYPFGAELRDTGRYGFVLPANQIRPTGIETFAGVKVLLANMK